MITPLEQAIQLAVRAHTGQIDKDDDNQPHIVHCFAVYQRVQEMFSGLQYNPPTLKKYTREEILIAAILHDTVEDSWENPTALERVDLDRIEAMFGKNVREIVDSVTRRKYLNGVVRYDVKESDPGVTKEFYRDHIYRAKDNEGGELIKIADNLHNRGRIHKIKQAKWRNKLEFKYMVTAHVLNDENQPTWEAASFHATYEGPHAIITIADPNGKKIEITEEQWHATPRRRHA